MAKKIEIAKDAAEIVVEKNYKFPAAGEVWEFQEVKFIRLPDGSLSIDAMELDKMHNTIATEILATDEPLTGDEFEFLCEFTKLRSNSPRKLKPIT